MLPYFPYQEDGANLAMIKKDIPEITEENFEENAEIIEDYYSISLNTVVSERYYDESYVPYLNDEIDDIEYYTPNPPQLPNFKVIPKLEGEKTIDCFLRSHSLSLLGLNAFIMSSLEADNYAKTYYGSLDPVNTKRDAFRHTIWNALMCLNFYTISSRKDKLDFATEVAELIEQCGNNGFATRQMDYHNNNVGRIIYNSNTSFKKFLWMKIGLNQPTKEELVNYAKEQVENNSIFIDLLMFSDIPAIQEEKAYFIVKNVSKTKSVYLSKKQSDGNEQGY